MRWAGCARNRGRCHHLAEQALTGEVAPDHEATGTGLVDDVKELPTADQPAQGLVQAGQISTDRAHVAHIALTRGLGHGDVNTVLVNIQTDKQGARFVHGPSPSNLATPRQRVRRVHWCSSAGLRPATYVRAGDGPPSFTKPSCLGVMRESDFIASIDCDFPYDSPIQWRKLSASAPRISSNAAFMILHEVCRVPRCVQMNRPRAERIISHLRRRFRHPAWKVVLPAVQSYLGEKQLRPVTAAARMRRVARYVGEYNALAICYFSAYDAHGALDRTYEEIVARWQELSGAVHDA